MREWTCAETEAWGSPEGRVWKYGDRTAERVALSQRVGEAGAQGCPISEIAGWDRRQAGRGLENVVEGLWQWALDWEWNACGLEPVGWEAEQADSTSEKVFWGSHQMGGVWQQAPWDSVWSARGTRSAGAPPYAERRRLSRSLAMRDSRSEEGLGWKSVLETREVQGRMNLPRPAVEGQWTGEPGGTLDLELGAVWRSAASALMFEQFEQPTASTTLASQLALEVALAVMKAAPQLTEPGVGSANAASPFEWELVG